MAGGLLFNVTVSFALVTGTGAGLLSVLNWEIFRHSPFGRVVFFISFFMSAFILYHVVLLALQTEPTEAKVLWSATHTLFVGLIWLMVRAQRRLHREEPAADADADPEAGA